MIVVPMHGLGGARDLPIPASLAISAAVAALVISFTVLILAWRTPRYDARTQGRPVPDGFARFVDGAPLRWTLRVVGLAVFVYLGSFVPSYLEPARLAVTRLRAGEVPDLGPIGRSGS